MHERWRRRLFGLAASAILIAVGALPAHADTIVSANITVDETWTADQTYVLNGVIYVTNGATLTIEPGTVVRGRPDSLTPGANNPGTLVITRGSKIQAAGTEESPIVFTDLDDSAVRCDQGVFPYDDPLNASGITGNWGGVILLGRGYVSSNTVSGPNPARTVQIEGLVADGVLGVYGGCSEFPAVFPGAVNCDDDDSGTIQYVSIRYGGFGLAPASEINGLTLGGVGRQTDIDHVEVFQNSDDAIEVFGGAVNMRYLVMAGNGDDGLDVDEGWRGKVQFLFNLQGTAGGQDSDKGSEQDSGTAGDGSQPFATPTIYNATMIGKGGSIVPAQDYTNRKQNTALNWRDNGGGRWYNSFFGDFGGEAAVLEGGTASSTAAGTSGARAITGYTPNTGNCNVTTGTVCDDDLDCPVTEKCVFHYRDPDSDFQLELKDNCFWCVGRQETLAAGGFPPAAPRAALTLPTFGVCAIGAAQCLTDAACGANGPCQDKPIDWIGTDPQTGGDQTKLHHDNGALSNAALNNDYLSCASALPIRSLVRDVRAFPDFDQVVSIDPRPAAGALVTPRTPPNDGFYVAAPYKGAFGASLWAARWTNFDRLGYLPFCDGTNGVIPSEVISLSFGTPGSKTRLTWTQPPLANSMGSQLYDVLRSGIASDFDPTTCVEQSDADLTAVDTSVPASGQVFFYLVRAVNECGEGSLGLQHPPAPRVGSCL